jgi:hypothetical protein
VHVGKDIWEITFDGFGDYDGETWAYRIQGKDKSNNQETTGWTNFIIDGGSATSKSSSGSGGGGSGSSGSNNNASSSNSGQKSGSGEKLTANENDDSWPYGGEYEHDVSSILKGFLLTESFYSLHTGVIQTSTGRILFFFNGEAFVCTGTVMDDQVEDRTVIVSVECYSNACCICDLA